MPNQQSHEFYRNFLGPFLAVAFLAGIILSIVERKINDYNRGKRYEKKEERLRKNDKKV